VGSKDRTLGDPGRDKQEKPSVEPGIPTITAGKEKTAAVPLPHKGQTATGRERAGIRRFCKEKPASVDLSPAEIGKFAREQEEIIKKLERARAERSGMMRVIRHPLAVLLENP